MIIYNLFPRLAGTMDQWPRWIDHIQRMGFNWIYVNPFHLTGGSGSLYAVRDYYHFNPIFVGSHGHAPLEVQLRVGIQALRSFLEHAHARGLKVAMDLVVNHTATDSHLVQRHPEWYRWRKDGRIVHPGCRDGRKRIVWGDLAQLDFRTRPALNGLRQYLNDVVAHYLRLGFDGFRCDAAYKIPSHLWKSLIRSAKRVHPGVLFMGETLGCSIRQVQRIQRAGFHAVFNSFRWWDLQNSGFLSGQNEVGKKGISVAFPESHDTPRLATDLGGDRSRVLQRYALACFFSGGVMMPLGYELGAMRQVRVVYSGLEAPETPRFALHDDIAHLHQLKRQYPVLAREAPLRWLPLGQGVCGYVKEIKGQRAVIAAHVWGPPRQVSISSAVLGSHARVVYGLRSLQAGALNVALVPGEVFVAISGKA